MNKNYKQELMKIFKENAEELQESVFLDIEKELQKHKFSTDMTGWDIVPKLTATMQLLRKKYVRE